MQMYTKFYSLSNLKKNSIYQNLRESKTFELESTEIIENNI